MKRSNLKRRKTARLKAFEAEVARLRPIIEARSGGRCEWPGKGWSPQTRCTERATELSHKIPGRSMAGRNVNGEELIDHLCSKHHAWVENHPVEARDLGLRLTANLPVRVKGSL